MYEGLRPLLGFLAIKSCLLSAVGKLKFKCYFLYEFCHLYEFARIPHFSVSFLNFIPLVLSP